MTQEITVMVTGVGGGVGQSIIKGLNLSMERKGDIEYRIVGVDADPLASGIYRTDAGYTVPMANEEGYIDRVIEIIEKEDVDVLIPGSDPEVLEIAENKSSIEDETDSTVLTSPAETVEIGLDKWETYNFLSENGFPTPETVLADDADSLVERKGFPIVVKPRTGSASRGLFIATNQGELEHALSKSSSEVIVQEYLVPDSWGDELDDSDLERQIDEYSTETIVSKQGEVVGSLSNWRKMVKGVPNIAKVKSFDDIRNACEEVVAEMDALGPINLQSRVVDGDPYFFEINTRYTGSTAVRCVAGFNGPDTMIRNLLLDKEIRPEDLEFEDLVEMRYKDEVYISEEMYRKVEETGEVPRQGDVYEYY